MNQQSVDFKERINTKHQQALNKIYTYLADQINNSLQISLCATDAIETEIKYSLKTDPTTNIVTLNENLNLLRQGILRCSKVVEKLRSQLQIK